MSTAAEIDHLDTQSWWADKKVALSATEAPSRHRDELLGELGALLVAKGDVKWGRVRVLKVDTEVRQKDVDAR